MKGVLTAVRAESVPTIYFALGTDWRSRLSETIPQQGNLGHGLFPDTRVDNAIAFVGTVKGFKTAPPG